MMMTNSEMRLTIKTKAIILCNPNNPTGKVFSLEEMEFIGNLCKEFDAICFTDEIYEHILYPRDGAEIKHISMAQTRRNARSDRYRKLAFKKHTR